MGDKASILIVDDDDGMCETLSDIMEDKGYRVHVAMDGYRAIEQVREVTFDVILMDIRMPGMNGVDTFRMVKSIQPDAAVVMMTAYAVEDLIMEALREGAYTVLYKPLDLERMINLIGNMQNGGLVLVVDGDPLSGEALKDLLENRGHQVSTALSGEEAVEMVRESSYDMIFMEMELPAMNGLETLLTLKEIDPQAVVVMMTDYHREARDSMADALEKEAHTVLYKPFDVGQVVQLVDEIRRRKLQRQG